MLELIEFSLLFGQRAIEVLNFDLKVFESFGQGLILVFEFNDDLIFFLLNFEHL